MLATDALSEWILKNIEAKKEVLPRLQNIKTQKDFENLLSDARKSKEIKLKNDDVTLITFELSDSKNNSFKIQETPQKKEIVIQENSKENLQNDLTINNLAKNKTEKSVIIESLIVENEKLTVINEKLQKTNKLLKAGLLLVVVLSVLLFSIPKILHNQEPTPQQIPTKTPPKTETPVIKEEPKLPPTPKSMQLLKGTIVYNKDNKDIQQFKAGLNTDFEVVALEEDDNYIKFEIELYISKSKIAQDKDNEITINANNNVRIAPEIKDETVFGTMGTQTRFYKIPYENNDWIKFKFIGYSKKEK